jgi:hypothetical protein
MSTSDLATGNSMIQQPESVDSDELPPHVDSPFPDGRSPFCGVPKENFEGAQGSDSDALPALVFSTDSDDPPPLLSLISDELDLKVGECVVYRDFVNQYTCEGKKMATLQLVILTDDESEDSDEPPPLLSLTDDESEDSDEPPSLLDSSSDSEEDPLLDAASQLFYSFQRIYPTSYHAQNRFDGSGVEVSLKRFMRGWFPRCKGDPSCRRPFQRR